MNFTRSELEDAGFVGWLPVMDTPPKLETCPSTPGVYVVTYSAGTPTAFLEKSPGGWLNGTDPTVRSEQLTANWVEGAEVVYIGNSENLRNRLKALADFGAGKPVRHKGGRLIWQLPSIAGLLVAWKETPDRASVKKNLIGAFRSAYAIRQ